MSKETVPLLGPASACTRADRGDSMRHLMLFLFVMLSVCSGLCFNAFPPIAVSLQSLYGVSTFAVNSLAAIWNVTYVMFAPFGSLMMIKISVRFGMLFGNLLTLLGAVVRLVLAAAAPTSEIAFWGGLFTGSLLASLGQLVVLSAPPLISARWYPQRERVVATTIATSANQLGNALGFFVAPVIVTGPHLNELLVWLGIQVGIVAVSTILCFLLFRSFPDTPPSESAAALRFLHDKQAASEVCPPPVFLDNRLPDSEPNAAAASKSEECSVVEFHDRRPLLRLSYLLLLYVYATMVGCYFTLTTVLAEVLQPYYSESAVGWLGGILILAGLVGALPVGPLLDRRPWFKSALLVAVASLVVTLVVFYTGASRLSYGALAFVCAMLGIAAAAVMIVGLETSVELTFPAHEERGGNLLMLGANAHGLITLAVYSIAEDGELLGWVMIGLCTSALCVTACMPPRYIRLRYERVCELLASQGKSLNQS
eukprot:ANDGO_04019.mRNA.1 putative MFS-type transporter C09D4.1